MPKRKRDPDSYSLGYAASVFSAQAIRAALKILGLSQAELARKSGIPPSHLSDLLKVEGPRVRNFQGYQIKAIAAALGLKEAQLLSQEAVQFASIFTPKIESALRDVRDGKSEYELPVNAVQAMMLPLLGGADNNSFKSLFNFVAARVDRLTVRDIILLGAHRSMRALPIFYDDNYWQHVLEYQRKAAPITFELADALEGVSKASADIIEARMQKSSPPGEQRAEGKKPPSKD
jgi:transcriptional regulator with XRE-family HTH domain